MFFDERPSLPVGSFARGDASTLGEVYDASIRDQETRINQGALLWQLEDEIDKRNDAIRSAGGPELVNPFRRAMTPEERQEMLDTGAAGGFGAQHPHMIPTTFMERWINEYEGNLKELVQKRPELSQHVPPEGVLGHIGKRWQASKNNYEDVMARRGIDGVANYVTDPAALAAMAAGTFVGTLSSPIDLATNFAGFASPARKSLVNLALRNASANMLAQTALEPGVAAQNRAVGINYTLAEALGNIGTAGLIGGVLDFGIRAPGRAVISRFGRNTPADTLFSRNTPRGGLFTDAPDPQAVPGTIVDLPPIAPLDQEAVTRAANGDMAAMRSIYESVTGQKVDVPPELAELAAKAREGDMAAVRKLADDVGLTEDPAVKGAFDRLEIEGTDDAIANLRRELQARDVAADIDDGAVQRRVLQALKSQIDPDEPMPMGGLEVTQRNRIPDLSDEAELPAGTTGTNQHSRTLDFDGRPAQVRELDLKTAENSTAIRGLERNIQRLQSQVWDQERAGRVVAFEPKDGALKIVDGQARADLAKRIEGDTKAEGVVFREADGWTLREVEGIALYKNLRESKTSLMQTATLMRDYRELLDGTLPMESDFDITAANLSRLSDGAWGMLQRGEVSQDMAAMVAEFVPEANHAGIIQDLARAGITDVNEARRALPDLLPPTGMAEANAVLLGLPDDPAMRDMPLRAGADVDDPKGPAAKAQIERLSTELAPEIAEAQAVAKAVSDIDERIMDIRQEMRDPNIAPEDAAAKRLELRQAENDRAVAAGDMTTAERVVTEAMQRQADVDAAIADVIGMVPKGVEVRTFSAVTDLPASIMAEVVQGNAAAFRQALAGLHRAATPEARARAMAELERAKEGRAIEGLAQNNVIYVATYALDPQAIVAHETVHALRNMGQITDAELSLLAGRAKRDGVFNEDLYRQALAGRQNLDALLKEEAAAHLIQARKEGKSFGAKTDGIIDRLRSMLEAMGNALRGYGFRTADDVVDAILSGEMARRDVTRAVMRAEDVTAMAIRAIREGDYLVRRSGDQYYIHRSKLDPNAPETKVQQLGRPIGSAQVTLDETFRPLNADPDAAFVDLVEVSLRQRGRGVATALYNAIEKDLGRKLRPSGALTEDGFAFWKARDPDALQDYVRTSVGSGYSPAADMIADIPRLEARVAELEADGGYPEALRVAQMLLDERKTVRDARFSLRSSLDMSPEARKARAEEMGFDTGTVWYHGTRASEQFDAFATGRPTQNNLGFLGNVETKRHAVFFSDNLDVSQAYGGRVAPYYLRGDPVDLSTIQDSFVDSLDAFGDRDVWMQAKHGRQPWRFFDGELGERFRNWAEANGIEVVRFSEAIEDAAGREFDGTTVAVLDPSNIRSVNAAFDPAKSDSPNLMYSIRQDAEPEPSPKAMVKSTVRAYADALSELQARANELGVDPDDLARLTEQNPETAPIAQRMEAARAQLAEAIGDDQAQALTDIMVSAAPLMRNVDPTAVANMVDGLLDQLLPDPPPARPANDNALPTPLQRDMMDLQRIEEAGTLVSVCRL